MKNIRNYFSLIVLFLCICCSNRINKEKILLVGRELINTDLSKANSTENIVFIGSNLRKKIIELKKQNSISKFEIRNGDLNNPNGNSEAENILILNNEIQKVCVRLKYNSKKKKFDILGYMTE